MMDDDDDLESSGISDNTIVSIRKHRVLVLLCSTMVYYYR